MIAFFAILALLASAQSACVSSGSEVLGTCWYISQFGTANDDCDSLCTSLGGTADANAIINLAGSQGTRANCETVAQSFGIQANVFDVSGANCDNSGLGCFYNVGQTLRCISPTTTTSASSTFIGGRFCACDISSSSGFTDPHFAGFNGEQLDIAHDDQAANHYFNIFCKENVAINALFSPNVEELLYMTKFVAKFGNFNMQMDLDGFVASGQFEITSQNSGETSYKFEDGSVVVKKDDVTVKYDGYIYNMKAAFVGQDRYLDIFFQGPKINQKGNGIVGRTLTRTFSPEEFSQYSHFMRSSEYDFTCEL